MFRRMIRSDCFGQSEIEQQRVSEAETRRKQKRNLNSPATENAANCWSKNETEAKRSADQAHSLRAIFLGRDVGDVSLRGRDVATCYAIENSAGEEHPERCCESQYQKSDAGADDREEEHRPPAILVRQAAENRRED